MPEDEEMNHYALGRAGAGTVLRAACERLRIGVATDRIVVEAVTRGKDRRRAVANGGRAARTSP